MASYLRPRRGKKATAVAQLTGASCLKRGEVFFEVPDAGVGAGKGAIKMGDGSTDYANLPYFLQPFDPNSASIGFTDASAAESDPYTTNATHAAAITPTANLKTIFTNLKQLLLKYNSQLTSLNNDLDSFQNGVDKIYNKCVELGSTPTDKTPDSICNALDAMMDTKAPVITLDNYSETTSSNPYKHTAGTIDITGTIIDVSSSIISAKNVTNSGETVTYNYEDENVGKITSFSITVNLANNKTNNIQISATDSKGNVSDTIDIYIYRIYTGSINVNNGSTFFLYGSSSSGYVSFSSQGSKVNDLFYWSGSYVYARYDCVVSVYGSSSWNKHYKTSGTGYLCVHKNGSQVAGGSGWVGGDGVGISCSGSNISMKAGDWLALYYAADAALQGQSGSLTVSGTLK